MPPRAATARPPKQDRRSLHDAGLKNFRDVVSENGEDNDPLPRVVKEGPRRDNGAAPPSSHDFDRIDTRSVRSAWRAVVGLSGAADAGAGPGLRRSATAAGQGAAGRRGHGARLAAVDRRVRPDRARRSLILAGLGGVIVWQWPNMASLYRSARTSAPTTRSRTIRRQPKAAAPRSPTGWTRAAARPPPRRSRSPRSPPRRRAPPRPPPPWRRRSCSTRKTRPIRRASASSARRSGAPSASRPGPASRKRLRSAPTSRSPTAS